jgi:hypothetical protein
MTQNTTSSYEAYRQIAGLEAELKKAGFNKVQIFPNASVQARSSGDDLINAIAKAGIVRYQAATFADVVKKGGAVVVVETHFGQGAKATQILNKYNPIQSSSANSVESGPYQSMSGTPLILQQKGEYESFSGTPLLIEQNGEYKSYSGTPLLIEQKGEYQSFSGTPLLINTSGPYQSLSGTPLLLEQKGEYKSFSGTPLLLNNPTPLSSWLGLPALSK